LRLTDFIKNSFVFIGYSSFLSSGVLGFDATPSRIEPSSPTVASVRPSRAWASLLDRRSIRLLERGRAPEAKFIRADRDERVAIGHETEGLDTIFVPFKRCDFLPGS
jgi:hypothetical protein